MKTQKYYRRGTIPFWFAGSKPHSHTLCRAGMHKLWDIPKTATTLWVTVVPRDNDTLRRPGGAIKVQKRKHMCFCEQPDGTMKPTPINYGAWRDLSDEDECLLWVHVHYQE